MKPALARLAVLAAVLCGGASAPAFAATVNGTLLFDVMAKEKFPTTNYGTDPQLQVSNQSTFRKYIFLQFSVSGIPAGSTGITAQLRLRSETAATGRAVTAHVVALTPAWTETGVTWSAKPALGANLGSDSSHVIGQDSTFDVSAHVTGNGTFGLGLDTGYTGGDTTFTSEEGGVAPALVVTYTPPPAGLPTVSFNATDWNASETGAATATVQVVSSAAAPAGGLVVRYSLSGSAESNHTSLPAPDYFLSPAQATATTGTVTIAAGATTATITLTPYQDTNFEGTETAIFTLTPDAAYTVGTPRVAQVVIADNEPLPAPNPDHSAHGAGWEDDDQGGWIVPVTGTLPNGECSGMAVSRVHPGVHWYHRDATTDPDPRSRIYAIEVGHATNNGTVIKTIDVTAPAGWTDVWGNSPSKQWEDMAEDPDVPGVLWIGDIGNNGGRTDIRLFKVNEPNPYGAATSVQATAGYYLRYPGGLALNAECLFIFEGIPHILVKEGGNPRIFRAPTATLSTNSASPTIMELVGSVVSGGEKHSVSAFSFDRKRMVLATHAAMWVYVSQSGLDPVGTTLSPANAKLYIQDLLCTRAPVWALKHNGGSQDPEATKGSVEGGSFVGSGYDILFAGEGRQVTFYPAWWYETQPAPIPAVPNGEVANNAAPSVFLFKPQQGSTFSKAGAGVITLQAAASDYDGTIANVKFYHKLSTAGSRTLINTGTPTGGYHQLNWTITGVAIGTYTLSADATDNGGAVKTDSVTVTITN